MRRALAKLFTSDCDTTTCPECSIVHAPARLARLAMGRRPLGEAPADQGSRKAVPQRACRVQVDTFRGPAYHRETFGMPGGEERFGGGRTRSSRSVSQTSGTRTAWRRNSSQNVVGESPRIGRLLPQVLLGRSQVVFFGRVVVDESLLRAIRRAPCAAFSVLRTWILFRGIAFSFESVASSCP